MNRKSKRGEEFFFQFIILRVSNVTNEHENEDAMG